MRLLEKGIEDERAQPQPLGWERAGSMEVELQTREVMLAWSLSPRDYHSQLTWSITNSAGGDLLVPDDTKYITELSLILIFARLHHLCPSLYGSPDPSFTDHPPNSDVAHGITARSG